jgi:hypothetical protein
MLAGVACQVQRVPLNRAHDAGRQQCAHVKDFGREWETGTLVVLAAQL